MAKLLRGNYDVPKAVKSTTRKAKKSLTDQFEESALAKLGGSIAFVMKKNTFMWSGESSEETGG